MINKTDKKQSRMTGSPLIKIEFDNSQTNQKIPNQSTKHVNFGRSPSQICPDMILTNPEHPRGTRTEETLKKLLEMNESYLIEKIKVSDVPTPPKYSRKMPSKTGQSEYFQNYGHLTRGKSVPERGKKVEQNNSINKLPQSPITGYESTYHMDFVKKPSDSLTRSEKAKYKKSDAPSFNETSYHRDYSNMAASPTTSAKRVEVRLMGGGKLDDDTTYKQCYRLKTEGFKPIHPIIQKNNRIFMTLNNQVGSSYRDTFANSKKKKVPVESCKPKEKYSPTPNKGKYKTEYAGAYVEQAITKKNVFECLSPQELRSYVMTILND